MNRLRRLGVIVALSLLAACGRDAGHARSDLRKMNYEFSAADFVRAARAGDEKAVQLFLDGGMDVNSASESGDTALLGAAENNAVRIIRLLEKQTLDYDRKNKEGWTAFMKAIYANQLDAVRELAPHSREDLNRGLLLASLLGHTETAALLLKNGAEVDATSPEGATPLIYARKSGNQSLEKLLLDAGAESQSAAVNPTPVIVAAFDPATSAAAREVLLKDLHNLRKSPEEAWWKKYGLTLDDPGIFEKDSDADGFSNKEEFLADTSPIDPSSHPPAAAKLGWDGYHRENLPYTLDKVEKEAAVLRASDGKLVTAKAGETVGDWKVDQIRSQKSYDKDGHPFDGSDVVVTDRENRKIRLVPGIAAPGDASFAAVRLPFSEEVQRLKVGERFTLPNDGTRRYQVLDVREEQVVVREMGSGQTFTISK